MVLITKDSGYLTILGDEIRRRRGGDRIDVLFSKVGTATPMTDVRILDKDKNVQDKTWLSNNIEDGITLCYATILEMYIREHCRLSHKNIAAGHFTVDISTWEPTKIEAIEAQG